MGDFCAGCDGGLKVNGIPCLNKLRMPEKFCYWCWRNLVNSGKVVSTCGRLREKCSQHPYFYLYHGKIEAKSF